MSQRATRCAFRAAASVRGIAEPPRDRDRLVRQRRPPRRVAVVVGLDREPGEQRGAQRLVLVAVERLLEQRHLLAVDGADHDADPGAAERRPRQHVALAGRARQVRGLQEDRAAALRLPRPQQRVAEPRAAAATAATGRPRSPAEVAPPPSRTRTPPAPRRRPPRALPPPRRRRRRPPPRTGAARSPTRRRRAPPAPLRPAGGGGRGAPSTAPPAASPARGRGRTPASRRGPRARRPARERALERRPADRAGSPRSTSSTPNRGPITAAAASTSPASGPSRSSRWPITSRTPSGRPSAPDSAALRNSSRAKNGFPPVRRWTASASARRRIRRERGSGAGVEAGQADAIDGGVAAQVGERGGQRMGAAELRLAVRRDQQQPHRAGPAEHVAEQHEARLLRPVEVVEHDHRRALVADGGEQAGDRLEQPEPVLGRCRSAPGSRAGSAPAPASSRAVRAAAASGGTAAR